MSPEVQTAPGDPSLGGVLAASLRVSAAVEAPFESYREAPPPEAPTAAGVLVFWCALGVLLCLVLASLRLPDPPPAGRLAAAGAAALGLLVLGALGAAVLFHLGAHLRGADVPFERSLLLVALLSPLLPAHLALYWAPVPYLWALTTLYSAWLCSRGLIRLGLLPEGAAMALTAALGLSAAGVQGALSWKSGGAARPEDPPPSAAGASSAAAAPMASPSRRTQSWEAPSSSSGLDMVQKTEDMGAVPGQETAFAPEDKTDSDKRLSSLDRWSQRLGADGDLTQGLPPEQKRQILSMKQALDGIREEARKTGVVPTKEEVLLRVLMQAGGGGRSAGKKKTAPAKSRKPPLKKRRAADEDEEGEED